MKTTRFLMIIAAATAMMFTACNRDEELNLDDNTFVYDGVTYQMTPLMDGYAPYSQSIELTDSMPSITFDGWHTPESMRGKTINLVDIAENERYGFRIYGSVLFIDCAAEWEEGVATYNGRIGEDDEEGGCIFTSGTYNISGDNNKTTITLDCVLKNGKTIQMKLVTE